jgi:hypothetical protein
LPSEGVERRLGGALHLSTPSFRLARSGNGGFRPCGNELLFTGVHTHPHAAVSGPTDINRGAHSQRHPQSGWGRALLLPKTRLSRAGPNGQTHPMGNTWESHGGHMGWAAQRSRRGLLERVTLACMYGEDATWHRRSREIVASQIEGDRWRGQRRSAVADNWLVAVGLVCGVGCSGWRVGQVRVKLLVYPIDAK